MNKRQELEAIQAKSNKSEVMEANKSILGEPVWVTLPAHMTDHLPWRGTVTKVVDEEYLMVKPFGRNRKEESVSMYNIRSVTKKPKQPSDAKKAMLGQPTWSKRV